MQKLLDEPLGELLASVLPYVREVYHDMRLRLLFFTSPYAKSLMIRNYWQMEVKARVNMFRKIKAWPNIKH